MKKLLLIIIILSATLQANTKSAQDVVIPDPNFLAALIKGDVNLNGDGIIQYSVSIVFHSSNYLDPLAFQV